MWEKGKGRGGGRKGKEKKRKGKRGEGKEGSNLGSGGESLGVSPVREREQWGIWGRELTFLENPTDRKTEHNFLKGENSY